MLFEINKLNLIGIPVNIDLLLFGNETLNCDINCSIFLAVQKYIKNTCSVSILLFFHNILVKNCYL
jgi:hypothetical protein